MSKINPEETIITGKWIEQDNRILGDSNCKRVRELIDKYLIKVADIGWEKLYRDPKDGRLWEESYPQGELQGGGPPQLKYLTEEEARKKYQF